MRVVVGLGNPGPEYHGSRHNAGFMVVQTIAMRWRVPLRDAGVALAGIGEFADEEVHLLLPQTFMNRSGTALLGVFDHPAGEELIVVYDDVDLPVGSVRVRPRGGSGGHRGVASMIDACGSEFVRVRVGIGRPPDGMETADYVLAGMSNAEFAELERGLQCGADAVECVLKDGVEIAMNRFNRIPSALPS